MRLPRRHPLGLGPCLALVLALICLGQAPGRWVCLDGRPCAPCNEAQRLVVDSCDDCAACPAASEPADDRGDCPESTAPVDDCTSCCSFVTGDWDEGRPSAAPRLEPVTVALFLATPRVAAAPPRTEAAARTGAPPPLSAFRDVRSARAPPLA